MNLRFHDAYAATQLNGRGFRLFGCRSNDTARHRDAETFKDFFSLKFVNIHRFTP
jgi:hypothetical protein